MGAVPSGAVTQRRFAIVIATLTAAFAAVVGAVILLSPEGDPPPLPDPLESVFPLPGDAVVRQTAIEVDLPIGYRLEIEVDGVWIPPHEIGYIWEPGDHTVTIRWDTVEGTRPDPGEFTWTFRVF